MWGWIQTLLGIMMIVIQKEWQHFYPPRKTDLKISSNSFLFLLVKIRSSRYHIYPSGVILYKIMVLWFYDLRMLPFVRLQTLPQLWFMILQFTLQLLLCWLLFAHAIILDLDDRELSPEQTRVDPRIVFPPYHVPPLLLVNKKQWHFLLRCQC